LFRQLGDEGVLALMCDSTKALRDGVSPSEKDVSESLRKINENAEGRVAITTFSSNVGRIRTVAEAAEAAGREVLCRRAVRPCGRSSRAQARGSRREYRGRRVRRGC
ncbi:hypothetical protein ACCS56_37205, partial [Rhizobium ruizarguesonis]